MEVGLPGRGMRQGSPSNRMLVVGRMESGVGMIGVVCVVRDWVARDRMRCTRQDGFRRSAFGIGGCNDIHTHLFGFGAVG